MMTKIHNCYVKWVASKNVGQQKKCLKITYEWEALLSTHIFWLDHWKHRHMLSHDQMVLVIQFNTIAYETIDIIYVFKGQIKSFKNVNRIESWILMLKMITWWNGPITTRHRVVYVEIKMCFQWSANLDPNEVFFLCVKRQDFYLDVIKNTSIGLQFSKIL